MPQRRDSVIFLRHPKHLFEFAVQHVRRREELLETLVMMNLKLIRMS